MNVRRFNRQVTVMAVLAWIADACYRIFMGVVFGLALVSILVPDWWRL